MTRDEVSEQVLDATTLAEIQAARTLLRDWIGQHPEHENMRDLFEQLYLMEDAALTIAAQDRTNHAATPLLPARSAGG